MEVMSHEEYSGDRINYRLASHATHHSAENTDEEEKTISGYLVTHRIVGRINGECGTAFQTKGDANEGVDQYLVSSDLVVGRMVFAIPYIGYVASISHSFLGFLFLVLAPGSIVICAEVASIKKKEKK
jgi:signal peptidase I